MLLVSNKITHQKKKLNRKTGVEERQIKWQLKGGKTYRIAKRKKNEVIKFELKVILNRLRYIFMMSTLYVSSNSCMP